MKETVRIRDLVVFNKLIVGPIIIEPKRVRANYTVEKRSGEVVQSELMYSYAESLFDPQDPVDQNLASMMLIQVALNYGLFCKQIEFDGLFDSVDKRFILDMIENTSREIFVNKFLETNEFLKSPFDRIPPEIQKEYTAAQIVFTNRSFDNNELESIQTKVREDHYAILSSGGKDSLLTYGLIKELAVPHPVFINESGRHWFTAKNAYQYYQKTEPNTAKPWCNSDRMYNWMIRQMPFIKDNFQNIRADIYPIRLWTVPVFLFGVLPIARKRRCGHILIGNEYDSTQVSYAHKIRHFNALYDQSRYFDHRMTLYYSRKGWNIQQYSLLRSLSEILILKILVKRYPELQKEQVSCHAAHESDGRMLPCGKCEKCRRIIGMLKSMHADPTRCGYTVNQIESGLMALSQKSVKQIGSDAAHLYYLLKQEQLIPDNSFTQKLARSHPEILMLRFDRERSRIEEIPEGIQRKLLSIYLQYADGIVMREDHRWMQKKLDELLERN